METLQLILSIVIAMIMAFLGASTASGMMCLGERLAEGSSIVRKSSACPSCAAPLRTRDIIPVISWLSLKGRCRYCGGRIPVKHLVTELIMAAVFVLLYVRYGISLKCAQGAVLAGVMFGASSGDIKNGMIGNAFPVAGLIFWLASEPLLTGSRFDVPLKLASLLVVFLLLTLLVVVMEHFTNKRILGGGDIKMLFIVLLYLPYESAFYMLIGSAVLAVLLKIAERTKIPGTVFTVKDKDGNMIHPLMPLIAVSAMTVFLLFR